VGNKWSEEIVKLRTDIGELNLSFRND